MSAVTVREILITGIDHTRALKGAFCGAVAAGVWALEQPLDKALFSCSYDDVELLGRIVRRRRDDGWYPIGLLWHLENGALFGALYASYSPTLPLPPELRGPAAALAENFLFWPLGALLDRVHPARGELPRLGGNRRAFAQATLRHLLFGLVLGELERRLNPAVPPPGFQPEADYSSNGHGSLEHSMSV